MEFSKEEKTIIYKDYEENGWSAYKIWKGHLLKNWNYTSGIMNRKEGSGRPRSVTTA